MLWGTYVVVAAILKKYHTKPVIYLCGLHLRASARFPEMAPPSKFGQKETKNFNISLNNRIGADFIQTNSKISFWNDILKKKIQFRNFVINFWFILKRNFFFQ